MRSDKRGMTSDTAEASTAIRALLRIVPAAVMATVASLAGCGPGGSPDGSGRCRPPQLSVTPTAAAPGDRITVTGEGVFDDCADDGRRNPLSPGKDVAIAWDQGARPRIVARVSADDEGRFTTEVTVPADAERGRVRLRLLDAEPVIVTVR